MLNLVLRPFRSKGQRYTPGDFVKSPGDVLSFKSRITAGEIFVVKSLDEATTAYLKAFSARINIDLVGIVTQELNKQVAVETTIDDKVEEAEVVTPKVEPRVVTPTVEPKKEAKVVPVVKLK